MEKLKIIEDRELDLEIENIKVRLQIWRLEKQIKKVKAQRDKYKARLNAFQQWEDERQKQIHNDIENKS